MALVKDLPAAYGVHHRSKRGRTLISVKTRKRPTAKARPPSWQTQVENALGAVIPVETDDPRKVGSIIHKVLRDYILQGILEPETFLDQVSLAQGLEVSRTPVREAIRILKDEGLVSGDVNQRARVSSISYEELEALYAMRISSESLALAVAIPRNGPEDLARIETALTTLREATFEHLPTWVRIHRELHLALYCQAGEAATSLIRANIEKSERFQNIRWKHQTPRELGNDIHGEHRRIVESCLSRDIASGVEMLSRHLARTALDTLNDIAPDREPTLIRKALRISIHGATGLDEQTD